VCHQWIALCLYVQLILLDFCISIVALFCVFLNAKRKFKVGKFITFGILPGVFFIYPYFIGNIGAEYYYFFFLVVGFYILDKRQTILIFSIYIFILFIGSKYFIYNNVFEVKYHVLETVHYYPSIIASIIMLVIITYVFKSDTKNYLKAIKLKNTELELQSEEIKAQHNLLEERNHELATLHDELTSSLDYASHIQHSILLPISFVAKFFKSIFILNRPKDIVSGDFYWFKDVGHKKIIAVADCTGHGVPGAFMTAMANTLLNGIIDQKIVDPSKILNELNKGLFQSLNIEYQEEKVLDGLDIAICCINEEEKIIEFTGARRPLYQFRNNELIEHKDIKQSIGGTQNEEIKFVTSKIKYKAKDRFYMFSDGFADQFGGDSIKKSKLMLGQFKNLLKTVQSKDLSKHQEFLETYLDTWQKDQKQTDDILLIGFEV